jgi:hypothetical protein
MSDYILLMHMTPHAEPPEAWDRYVTALEKSGHLRGGSAIGDGVACRKDGAEGAITAHLTGFIRIEAESLEAAQALLAGNPVYESGGIVEIRELPKTR